MLLHLDPVLVLKSAGVIGLFFTCWAVYAISRLWLSRPIALIPCLWLLAYKGQILWTVSGLETTVYEALVCFSVYFIFRGMGYSAHPHTNLKNQSLPLNATSRGEGSKQLTLYFVVAGLLLALAGMTRPEATALMVLFTLLLLFTTVSASGDKTWQGFVLFCGTLCVCYAPYFFWRWHYYGRLFPNPVYCKGFTNILTFNLDKNYLRLTWPFIIMALFAVWQNNDRRYYFLWLPSVIYLILLIGADPIVAFDNRLFLPAFVLLLPLAVKGMATFLSAYLHKKNATDHTSSRGAYDEGSPTCAQNNIPSDPSQTRDDAPEVSEQLP